MRVLLNVREVLLRRQKTEGKNAISDRVISSDIARIFVRTTFLGEWSTLLDDSLSVCHCEGVRFWMDCFWMRCMCVQHFSSCRRWYHGRISWQLHFHGEYNPKVSLIKSSIVRLYFSLLLLVLSISK